MLGGEGARSTPILTIQSLSTAGANAVASDDVRARQSLNPIPTNYVNAKYYYFMTPFLITFFIAIKLK